MTLFVLENLDNNHRKIANILGTDYVATKLAWLHIPMMLILGIVIALVLSPVEGGVSNFIVGIIYGIMMILTGFLHGIGHLISSKIAQAPMTRLFATATVHITLYDDEGKDITQRMHLLRAIGGAMVNFDLAVMALVIGFVTESHFALFFGGFNLAYMLVSLIPLPSLDGYVILKALRQSNS